jgi:hypothetical protein
MLAFKGTKKVNVYITNDIYIYLFMRLIKQIVKITQNNPK